MAGKCSPGKRFVYHDLKCAYKEEPVYTGRLLVHASRVEQNNICLGGEGGKERTGMDEV